MDEFSTQFEREFSSLISTSVTSTSVWCIDSAISNHMTSLREHFTNLAEGGVDLEVVLGNDTKVKAVGCGTVTFQREFWLPIVVRDVLYVPRLMNLISVSTFYHKGQGV